MTDAEKIKRLKAALKPFADAGVVWLPEKESGFHAGFTAGDEHPTTILGEENGRAKPLTVGVLREAARAMQEVDPEYIEKWGEEGR